MKKKIVLTRAQMEATHYALDLYVDDPGDVPDARKVRAAYTTLVMLKHALGYNVPDFMYSRTQVKRGNRNEK